MGRLGAGLRVYVNIGSCPDYRFSLEDSYTGILRPPPLTSDAKAPTTQHPFDIAKAEKDCVDWQLTSARINDAANFLDAVQPYPLKNAQGGQAYLTADQTTLDTGKKAFGENCAPLPFEQASSRSHGSQQALRGGEVRMGEPGYVA